MIYRRIKFYFLIYIGGITYAKDGLCIDTVYYLILGRFGLSFHTFKIISYKSK